MKQINEVNANNSKHAEMFSLQEEIKDSYLVKGYLSKELTWNCHFSNLTQLVKITRIAAGNQQQLDKILVKDYSVSMSLVFCNGEHLAKGLFPENCIKSSSVESDHSRSKMHLFPISCIAIELATI